MVWIAELALPAKADGAAMKRSPILDWPESQPDYHVHADTAAAGACALTIRRRRSCSPSWSLFSILI